MHSKPLSRAQCVQSPVSAWLILAAGVWAAMFVVGSDAQSVCGRNYTFTDFAPNIFDPSQCAALAVCSARRCGCMGMPSTEIAASRGVACDEPMSGAGCQGPAACYVAYTACVADVATLALEFTTSPCYLWGLQLRVAALQAAALDVAAENHAAATATQLYTSCAASGCAFINTVRPAAFADVDCQSAVVETACGIAGLDRVLTDASSRAEQAANATALRTSLSMVVSISPGAAGLAAISADPLLRDQLAQAIARDIARHLIASPQYVRVDDIVPLSASTDEVGWVARCSLLPMGNETSVETARARFTILNASASAASALTLTDTRLVFAVVSEAEVRVVAAWTEQPPPPAVTAAPTAPPPPRVITFAPLSISNAVSHSWMWGTAATCYVFLLSALPPALLYM